MTPGMSQDEEAFLGDLLEFAAENWSAYRSFMVLRGWDEAELEPLAGRILRRLGRS